jgi:hypothetical protein
MRRFAKLVGLVALAPLIMGGGAGSPPTPGATVGGQTFQADILIDPHMAAGDHVGPITVSQDITPTAKQGSIALRAVKKGTLLAEVEFKALPTKAFFLGCDPTLSDGRFNRSITNGGFLDDWIPEATLQYLFRSQGITPGLPNPGAANRPVIIQILNGSGQGECFTDLRQPTSIPDGGDGSSSIPGVLFLQVVIRFEIP